MRNYSKSNIGNEHQRHNADDLDQLVYRINLRGSDDAGLLKDVEQPKGPSINEHSKAFKVTKAAIKGAFLGSAVVLSGIAAKDMGTHIYRSVEYVREMQSDIATAKERAYQATGIVATSGENTHNIFGTMYLDSADGTSYTPGKDRSGMSFLPNKHSFSIVLDANVRILAKSGNQTLQVINLMNAVNYGNGYLTYNNNSEISRKIPTSELSAIVRGVEGTFSKEPPIINSINKMRGNGAVGLTGNTNWREHYAYHRYMQMLKFPVNCGLDISVKTEGSNVIMDFSQFHISKGIIDMKHKDLIDKVVYPVKGLEKAYLVVNKDNVAGLTIKGYGSRAELQSKNLEGGFGLYEMKHKQIMPLVMSSSTDWSITGGTYNVRVSGMGSDYVVVSTKPAGPQ